MIPNINRNPASDKRGACIDAGSLLSSSRKIDRHFFENGRSACRFVIESPVLTPFFLSSFTLKTMSLFPLLSALVAGFSGDLQGDGIEVEFGFLKPGMLVCHLPASFASVHAIREDVF